MQRTNSGLASDLLIELRRDRRVPLHRQIEAAVRDGIRSGRLQLDTSLPPTRTMAAQLGVSRGVVVEAYQQLVAEGYLTSRPGGYTRIAVGPESLRKRARPAAEQAPAIDFGYGRADVSSFPRAAWLRSIRRVLTETPDERFGYLSGRGVPELCEVLAEYLNRVRGTSADPESIVLCNGYAQGIALLVQVLARSGARRLALEDPSSGDDALPAAIEAGLEVVGVPVDEHGIRVDALERSDADAVVLTPSHQWPVGAVLSAESRGAILRWAKRRGALVIEDDYDAEYRYDRAPIGAMQGLAPDHVVYAGTASKTLAPGLRLAWLVVPQRLVEDVAATKILADRGSPALDQLAFAAAPRRTPGRAARLAAGLPADRDRRRPAPRRVAAGRPRRGDGGRGRRASRGRRLRHRAVSDRLARPGRPDLRLRHAERAHDRRGHRDPGRRGR
jgi:GntR family transcriptional regulator/MocR family aminotransferase